MLLCSPNYGFLSVHSAVCAHLHRLGSEWLWGDVHDVHFINRKYWFVKERFQLGKCGIRAYWLASGSFLSIPLYTWMAQAVLGWGFSSLTAKPVP